MCSLGHREKESLKTGKTHQTNVSQIIKKIGKVHLFCPLAVSWFELNSALRYLIIIIIILEIKLYYLCCLVSGKPHSTILAEESLRWWKNTWRWRIWISQIVFEQFYHVFVIQSVGCFFHKSSCNLLRSVGHKFISLSHKPLVHGLVGRVCNILPNPTCMPATESAGLCQGNSFVALKIKKFKSIKIVL